MPSESVSDAGLRQRVGTAAGGRGCAGRDLYIDPWGEGATRAPGRLCDCQDRLADPPLAIPSSRDESVDELRSGPTRGAGTRHHCFMAQRCESTCGRTGCEPQCAGLHAVSAARFALAAHPRPDRHHPDTIARPCLLTGY